VIAAELVGPSGRIAAVEIDAALADKARAALAAWPQVAVRTDDGTRLSFAPVEVLSVPGRLYRLRRYARS
jgi:protein-L-isoaspartate(D-aspartate) O-methyltransferase